MDYMAIKVSTIVPNSKFTFDLFIKINEKHLLYIKNGDDIDQARLDNLKRQGMDRIFVTGEDFPNYKGFVSEKIKSAIEDDSMPTEEKVDIVENASINAVDSFQNMVDSPEAEETYNMVIQASKGLMAVINKDPRALQVIFSKRGKAHSVILEHCKNVAAIATRFAFLQGLRGEELDNLGTAALLHDMGLNLLGAEEQKNLFTRRYDMFTPDDKRIYFHHPEDAVKMIEKKPFSNPNVLNLIMKHEEKSSGKGYPKKEVKLTKSEEILSLVNCLDRKITGYGMGVVPALNEIYKTEIGNYDLNLIKDLKVVLQEHGLLDENL